MQAVSDERSLYDESVDSVYGNCDAASTPFTL